MLLHAQHLAPRDREPGSLRKNTIRLVNHLHIREHEPLNEIPRGNQKLPKELADAQGLPFALQPHGKTLTHQALHMLTACCLVALWCFACVRRHGARMICIASWCGIGKRFNQVDCKIRAGNLVPMVLKEMPFFLLCVLAIPSNCKMQSDFTPQPSKI